jgi:hypothetical protein
VRRGKKGGRRPDSVERRTSNRVHVVVTRSYCRACICADWAVGVNECRQRRECKKKNTKKPGECERGVCNAEEIEQGDKGASARKARER